MTAPDRAARRPRRRGRLLRPLVRLRARRRRRRRRGRARRPGRRRRRARRRRRRPVPPRAQRPGRRARPRERGRVVKKRVIPCLDVAGGRVVKGVRFEGLRDMGDPVELATRYSELGADELVFLDVTATIEGRAAAARAGRARRRGAGDPVHGRRRDRRARGRPRACSAPGADKVVAEPGGRRRPAAAHRARRTSSAPRRSSARSTPAAARSSRTAGATPRGLDAVAWAQEAVERGAGEILLTSIDADGTRAGYDLELTRAVARRGLRPGDRLRRRGRRRATWPRRSRPAPRRRSSRRSSTSGPSGCRS